MSLEELDDRKFKELCRHCLSETSVQRCPICGFLICQPCYDGMKRQYQGLAGVYHRDILK